MLNLAFSLHQTTSLVSAGILEQHTGWMHDERIISSFEIIIGIKGTLYMTQAGMNYEVHPGNMLLLLPGLQHGGMRPCAGDISFYWFHFLVKRYSIVEDNLMQNRLWMLSNKTEPGSVHECILPLYCALSPSDELQIFLSQMLHVNNVPYYTRQMQDNLLSLLLIQLTQNYIDIYRSINAVHQSSRTFTEMLEWLRMNYDQRLLITDVARRFNYNDDYFSRMFKMRTGYYFADYMNHLRINRAKTLLYQTTCSIKEIAYQVGFPDEKYFMRVFRKYEGITALHYRNAFYLTHKNLK